MRYKEEKRNILILLERKTKGEKTKNDSFLIVVRGDNDLCVF